MTYSDCLLVDIGSTTTGVIPIVGDARELSPV